MTELRKRLKHYFCSHEFKGADMEPRNGDGIVKWACYKCGKEFEAENGLDILKHGKCIGGWGEYTPIDDGHTKNIPPGAR